MKAGLQQPTGEVLGEIGTFPAFDFDLTFVEAHKEKQGCYDKERKLNRVDAEARDQYLTECFDNGLTERASTASKYSIAWVVTAKKDLDGAWTDKR